MILKNETIAVLENYQKINDSIAFFKGNILRAINYSHNGHVDKDPGAIIASAKVAEYFTRDFNIENLGDFLKTIKAFKGADIDLGDEESTYCTIKYSSTDIVASYNYCSIDEVNPVKKDVVMPEPEIKFTIHEKTLNDLVKFCKLQNLEHLLISPSDDGDQIKITALKIGYGDSNTCEIYLDAEINNLPEFSAIIDFKYIKVLMQGTYDVSIAYEDESEIVGLAEFSCKHKLGRSDYKGIRYWIALNTQSKHGEEDQSDQSDLDGQVDQDDQDDIDVE